MILPILNMDVTPFVQFLVFVAYIGLIFGLSVELIGRNPLNMLRVRDKEEGSAMNAEGSVKTTSEDSAITSEGSAIKNENSVKERKTQREIHVWLIEVRSFFRLLSDTQTQSSLKKLLIFSAFVN